MTITKFVFISENALRQDPTSSYLKGSIGAVVGETRNFFKIADLRSTRTNNLPWKVKKSDCTPFDLGSMEDSFNLPSSSINEDSFHDSIEEDSFDSSDSEDRSDRVNSLMGALGITSVSAQAILNILGR